MDEKKVVNLKKPFELIEEFAEILTMDISMWIEKLSQCRKSNQQNAQKKK